MTETPDTIVICRAMGCINFRTDGDGCNLKQIEVDAMGFCQHCMTSAITMPTTCPDHKSLKTDKGIDVKDSCIYENKCMIAGNKPSFCLIK